MVDAGLQSPADDCAPKAAASPFTRCLESEPAATCGRDERATIRQVVLNLLVQFDQIHAARWRDLAEGRLDRVRRAVSQRQRHRLRYRKTKFRLSWPRSVRVQNSIKSAEQGAGLGLPIAKSLIDMHGGTFTLKSKLRIGTEVVITFPPGACDVGVGARSKRRRCSPTSSACRFLKTNAASATSRS